MANRLAAHYERHQPERTMLYQIVQEHYPIFRSQLEEDGKSLPDYVQREFDDYLRCGILEHGFLRVRCDHCHFERLVAYSWPLLRISAIAPALLYLPPSMAVACARGIRDSIHVINAEAFARVVVSGEW